MKLLVIAPHYNYFIKDQVEALSKYLDEIVVFVKHNPLVEPFSRFPFLGYSSHLKNYTYERIVNLQGIPENVSVHPIRVIYFKPDGQNLKLCKILTKRINRKIREKGIQFDIIHSHFVYHYGCVGARLKEEYNKPLVTTAHGDDVYSFPFKSQKWRKLIVDTLNLSDFVITVSSQNRNILVKKLKIRDNKVVIVPNGFNSKLFHSLNKAEARQLLDIPLDKKVVLNVASLTPLKGQEYLINAISTVTKNEQNVLTIIVGNGPLKKELENQIKRLNLENHVIFVGTRPHNEIPLWMNAADVFVLPSLNEGNPTVMFEALGVGLPFVGTAVGGVPEIIVSEDYGLLCPPADPECLAEKILIALNKEWDRDKIRKYAKQFTWENIAKRILKIYTKVVGDSS